MELEGKLEDKEQELCKEKGKLERKIKTLEKKVVEFEEKERKEAQCNDVLLDKKIRMLDDKEVKLNEKERQLSARVREIELMDQYNDYLNGRIEAFEARQHFSDQIIDNLQKDIVWQKRDNIWLDNINDTNQVTIRNLQIENSKFTARIQKLESEN